MKNVHQILNTLQNKPQFSKLTESKCIQTLRLALLPSIQKNIKKSYIHNNTLYFILTTRINKLDADSIINNIKMILNSPMILKSKKFVECSETKIDDVKIYTDFKPKKSHKLFIPSSHNIHYKERATGDITFTFSDENLNKIANEIKNIIQKQKNES
ncbi:hypothetical protein MNB_SM-3-1383 [hydrothermal vent metagenome]|uniref:Uncharacterized protein n=1 Tax=hydrothermal vent metagenome TaxID=652676 RepID=A0A1W1D1E7_9ZZZZ